MIVTQRKKFSPADRTANETTALFDVPKGSRVVWASCRKLRLAEAGSTSTMTLGDGADPDGFIASAQLDPETGTIGDLVDGQGAYFVTSGGKLYLVDDKVDVDYVASGTPGAVAPVVLFQIGVAREWEP